jgi:hypothetical protein
VRIVPPCHERRVKNELQKIDTVKTETLPATLAAHLPGFPATLAELYEHQDFIPFPRSSDEWINDPDRMERCHTAAEHGADGSTHAEIIQDWRDFLETLTSDAARTLESLDMESEEINALVETLETITDSIADEIDTCEAWHESNGSLHEEIG